MYISFDNGERWQPMQFNLPVTPITDLAIHKRDKELVAATQGRSFWIFDDLPLIHQMMDAGGLNAVGETQLYKPKESYRMPGGGGFPLGPTATIGRNPANGVVVYYSLKTKPTADVQIEFLDSTGKSIRKFTGRVRVPVRLQLVDNRPRRLLRMKVVLVAALRPQLQLMLDSIGSSGTHGILTPSVFPE
jgi:hypothetical protein